MSSPQSDSSPPVLLCRQGRMAQFGFSLPQDKLMTFSICVSSMLYCLLLQPRRDCLQADQHPFCKCSFMLRIAVGLPGRPGHSQSHRFSHDRHWVSADRDGVVTSLLSNFEACCGQALLYLSAGCTVGSRSRCLDQQEEITRSEAFQRWHILIWSGRC